MKHVVMNWDRAFFVVLSLLVVLAFLHFSIFCDISFYSIYHSTGVCSLGVVLTVHIWKEFNVVNSKYGG